MIASSDKSAMAVSQGASSNAALISSWVAFEGAVICEDDLCHRNVLRNLG